MIIFILFPQNHFNWEWELESRIPMKSSPKWVKKRRKKTRGETRKNRFFELKPEFQSFIICIHNSFFFLHFLLQSHWFCKGESNHIHGDFRGFKRMRENLENLLTSTNDEFLCRFIFIWFPYRKTWKETEKTLLNNLFEPNSIEIFYLKFSLSAPLNNE